MHTKAHKVNTTPLSMALFEQRIVSIKILTSYLFYVLFTDSGRKGTTIFWNTQEKVEKSVIFYRKRLFFYRKWVREEGIRGVKIGKW